MAVWDVLCVCGGGGLLLHYLYIMSFALFRCLALVLFVFIFVCFFLSSSFEGLIGGFINFGVVFCKAHYEMRTCRNGVRARECAERFDDEASISTTKSALRLKWHMFKKGRFGQENTIKMGFGKEKPFEKNLLFKRISKVSSCPPPGGQQVEALVVQHRCPSY